MDQSECKNRELTDFKSTLLSVGSLVSKLVSSCYWVKWF